MFGYNNTLYGGGDPLTTTNQDDIVINGFGLQNEFIKTSFSGESNLIDFSSFDYPKNNGRGFLGYYNRGKQIRLDLFISGKNKEDFHKKLDNLRKNLFIPEVNLDIKVNGKVRRIKVNCISSSKDFNHYNITFIKTTVILETLEPFFYELFNQTSSFLGKTSSFDEYIYNSGTAISSPRVNLAFNSGITGVENISFKIGEKILNINHKIQDGDFLIIDCENFKVKLNDQEIDFDGEFPILEINGNPLNFTIDGTFNVDINVLNKINYV